MYILVIDYQKLKGGIYFWFAVIFDPFWGTNGVRQGVKKGRKLAIWQLIAIKS